jgi:hypothetical protein
MKILDLVKGQTVHFDFYRSGELWYKTDSGFSFPVPSSDIGNGVFLRDDKAILFMRYIRQHLNNVEEERKKVNAF